ncbi:CENP-B N-terminal DNA-binding domain [Popillia japonica]|uniref:CENP-B N-terminal DNA-binding domain n=1 Tax=Popillia japonica TaxID=7064 RepID=A0AAW1IZM1_POPJA
MWGRFGLSGDVPCFIYLIVRTYKRKRPTQPEIPRDVLNNAVKNVIRKSTSLRAAAMRLNIPKSTLFDRVVRATKRSNNNIEDSGNEGGESEKELPLFQ